MQKARRGRKEDAGERRTERRDPCAAEGRAEAGVAVLGEPPIDRSAARCRTPTTARRGRWQSKSALATMVMSVLVAHPRRGVRARERVGRERHSQTQRTGWKARCPRRACRQSLASNVIVTGAANAVDVVSPPARQRARAKRAGRMVSVTATVEPAQFRMQERDCGGPCGSRSISWVDLSHLCRSVMPLAER